MAYELPDPGKAYLSYKLEDAPDVSVKNWYNKQGKSYTKWRQWTAYNTPEYQQWKAQQLQDYQNYMDAYNANYNSEASTRARLEAAKFSGQYLANGIGGSSASSTGVIPPLQQSGGDSHISKGLEKVYQSLQLMSAAGMAMKNFGEGKAAMRYADDLASSKVGLTRQKTQTEAYNTIYMSDKVDAQSISNTLNRLLDASPEDNGYHWDKSVGMYVFTGKNAAGDPVIHNLRVQNYINTLNSDNFKNNLYYQQSLLNSLTYENRKAYEAATMQAQKEILEGKRDLQLIEKEYAEKIKRMGLAAPLLKAALDGIKLFM